MHSGDIKVEQEAPQPRRAQHVRSAQLVYFMPFVGRKSVYG